MPPRQTKTPDSGRRMSASFTTLDEFQHLVAGWDLDFCQLDRGEATGEIAEVAGDGFGLMKFEFSRAYAQRGATPRGMRTFGILAQESGGVRSAGAAMSDDSILAFPTNGEFEAASGPGFAAFSLSVSEEILRTTAELMGIPRIDRLTAPGVHHLEATAVRRLRAALGATCREDPMEPGRGRAANERLSADISSMLVETLASGPAEGATVPDSRLRAMAVKRARRMLEERADEPVAIGEICQATGVSWRTLNYAFREHFGVTPKAYQKAIRLDRVRKDLLDADPSTSVADVANRWGFWHMGQFATDYRRQFGELPSATRNRRRQGKPGAG